MDKNEWQARLKNCFVDFSPLDSLKVLDNLVTESYEISSWEEFQQWFSPFKANGCFRGHRKFEWFLETTFDRAIFKEYSLPHGRAAHPMCRQLNEDFLIQEYQRAAHLYHHSLPKQDQTDEWLALMQHHGCPTRLLDWTHSPYVALYFSVYEESEDDGALWALDLNWAAEVASQFEEEWNDLAEEEKERKIYPKVVKPSIRALNQRMVAQRGELLSVVTQSRSADSINFAVTLLAMIIHDRRKQDRGPILSKVKVKKAKRFEFLDELIRMNVHHASLFPGPDGYSKYISLLLELRVQSQTNDAIRRDSNDSKQSQP